MTMDLQLKLREAMKAKDDMARDLLRVVLGEVTRRGQTSKDASDDEVFAIIRKVIAGNTETRKELEKRGRTTEDTYQRLARENAYLESLLPAVLDRASIRKELEPVAADLKAAKNDGQATGVAMKHLRQKGLAVQGEEVAAAVKEIRGG
jgi:uncharacterized protein YqeY